MKRRKQIKYKNRLETDQLILSQIIDCHKLTRLANSKQPQPQNSKNPIKMTSRYNYGYTTGTTDYGANRTTYDPTTGAYDQHIDYDVDATTRRHHREQMDEAGRYYHRDVDTDTSGYDNTTRVHKEYSNPNTGTSYHRDATYDRNTYV